jgi:hypothetical protein
LDKASPASAPDINRAERYVAQAEQRLLARGGQSKRDAMYEQERLDAIIEASDDVARLRA